MYYVYTSKKEITQKQNDHTYKLKWIIEISKDLLCARENKFDFSFIEKFIVHLCKLI